MSRSVAAYFGAAADETVDGVATTHYTCTNARALNFLSGLYDVSGEATWTGDIWVAKTGGYPVRFKLASTGVSTVNLQFDVTKANDPGNAIAIPAS